MTKVEIEKRTYDKISHAQRIKVIYLKQIHNLSLGDIEAATEVKYNTIRNILRTFVLVGELTRRSTKRRASGAKL